MQSKQVLTKDDVKEIAAVSETEATQNNWRVAISVVDDGGNPLWLQRLDSAAPISAYVAQAKAKSAALGRRETKGYEDMINQGRFAFITAPNLEGMLEGGIPIEVDGQCLGAVGVSGVKLIEGAQIARAGITAFTETLIK